MCKAIKNSIRAFFLLPTWGNAILRCSCVNTIAAICYGEPFCLQKGDLCCRHISNGALIKALLCTKGKNAKFMARQRVLPGLIPQFSVLCIITMRKLMLFYVPYHVSGIFGRGGRKGEGKRMYLGFLFLVSDWSWHNDQLIFDLWETDSPGMILITPTCWSKEVPLGCWYRRALTPEQPLKWQTCAQLRYRSFSLLEDVANALQGGLFV